MADDPALDELLNLIRMEWASLSDASHSDEEAAACRDAIKKYYVLLGLALHIDEAPPPQS